MKNSGGKVARRAVEVTTTDREHAAIALYLLKSLGHRFNTGQNLGTRIEWCMWRANMVTRLAKEIGCYDELMTLIWDTPTLSISCEELEDGDETPLTRSGKQKIHRLSKWRRWGPMK